MRVKIEKSVPSGTVNAPCSKSYAHRSLILGAFSDKSEINNISFSDDIMATLSCLQALGAEIDLGDDYAKIGGIDLNKVEDGTKLYCNESGSTIRFLIPVCLLTGKRITLYGTEKLLSRPLEEYENICKNNGFLFEKESECVTVCGELKPGKYSLKSDISSQYITGLLIALSLADGVSEIALSGEVESRPYIDMTLETIKRFGIEVTEQDNVITVNGGKRPQNTVYCVEADASNAAYLEAFGLFGNIVVTGVSNTTLQGDIIYKKYFEELKNGKKEFDLKNCPDLAPIMFSACCLFGGASFTGTRRLKFKESDRAFAMAEELKKFGVFIRIDADSVTVNAKNLSKPSMSLCGHNDHRIVMALALLCTKFGGEIEGCEAVSKSFPDFFERISQLKIGVNKNA